MATISKNPQEFVSHTGETVVARCSSGRPTDELSQWAASAGFDDDINVISIPLPGADRAGVSVYLVRAHFWVVSPEDGTRVLNRDILRTVRSLPGFKDFGKWFLPVYPCQAEEYVVDQMLKFAEEGQPSAQDDSQALAAGDRVDVVSGQYAGCSGTVAMTPSGQTAMVRLEVFGHPVEVECLTSQLSRQKEEED